MEDGYVVNGGEGKLGRAFIYRRGYGGIVYKRASMGAPRLIGLRLQHKLFS